MGDSTADSMGDSRTDSMRDMDVDNQWGHMRDFTRTLIAYANPDPTITLADKKLIHQANMTYVINILKANPHIAAALRDSITAQQNTAQKPAQKPAPKRVRKPKLVPATTGLFASPSPSPSLPYT